MVAAVRVPPVKVTTSVAGITKVLPAGIEPVAAEPATAVTPTEPVEFNARFSMFLTVTEGTAIFMPPTLSVNVSVSVPSPPSRTSPAERPVAIVLKASSPAPPVKLFRPVVSELTPNHHNPLI